MKILLNGGLGFIGKRFIEKFSNQHDIVVYARKEDVANTKGFIHLKNVILEEGNTEDSKISEVITKHSPDVIVHLAALTGLKKCHDNPEKAFKVNVFGTFNALNACSKTGSKFIFISSREVYGETIGEKSSEDDPLLPNNVYGITKKIGEGLVQLMAKKHGFDFTILRLTNVFGHEGDQYGAQIIIKDALLKKQVRILGGSQRLNYVYVDDIIDIINLVLQDKRSTDQIFNVGSDYSVTIEEFVNTVIEMLDDKVQIEYHPMRSTETSKFNPDLTKIKNVLNYSTKTSLREGIAKTIKWYSEIKISKGNQN